MPQGDSNGTTTSTPTPDEGIIPAIIG